MKRERFDLALQLHGGGRYSNPFLRRLGVATRWEHGLRTLFLWNAHCPMRITSTNRCGPWKWQGSPGRPRLGWKHGFAPWTSSVSAPRRCWGTTRYRGTGPGGRIRCRPAGVVVVHPGATDPRRRWPAARFAEVAAACAADGCTVLVVGDASERHLAADVVRASGSENVRSIAGEADLGTLAALLARCDVMVANDSGPRHLAQALGTPTVGIYWAGNALNAGPLGRSLHRLHLSWLTHCPECGADITQVGWTAPRCGHDSSLVSGVRPEAVYADVRPLRAMNPRPRGRSASP